MLPTVFTNGTIGTNGITNGTIGRTLNDIGRTIGTIGRTMNARYDRKLYRFFPQIFALNLRQHINSYSFLACAVRACQLLFQSEQTIM